jgi:hypothetical protein
VGLSLQEQFRRVCAEEMARHLPLTAEEILTIWERHPKWAPSLPSSPRRAMLAILRRFL